MSERANQLLRIADGRVAQLIDALARSDESVLGRPCAGREKLGDGSVGACAAHTADNYLRIAAFARAEEYLPVGARAHMPHGRHRIPQFRRAAGHRRDRGRGAHDAPYGVDTLDRRALLDRLSAASSALALLADLTDEQLDAVPPASDMRFCDGRRTLEQIVRNLLKHQDHQLDALAAALG